MTDRINALTIVLDKDYRDEDAQAIIDAILMIRGVMHVTEHVVEPISLIAEVRAKTELQSKLWEVLKV
jgi:hypothetical protein